MRIAILEDDLALAGYVEKSLLASGNSCTTFADGQALVQNLHRETFDMLILDWNVPGMSGLEVLAWMRANLDTPPPALMLTSRSAEEDIVTGLLAGADDYVIKPVSPSVLLARVTAVARRAYPEPVSPVETFGQFRFDSRRETAEFQGRAIALTAKEFALAILLFRNRNRALSRAYLLETIWGVKPGLPTRTLDAHISNVRTKLTLRPANGFKLTPIYSYGYRLEDLTQ
ncbi:response regulator transcription factor [Novosphingobium sp. KA1]|uniref:response regulator transcription factor n=1 Tax=Novosphingobium sp. (strain KA1) TaxID=164608 RepID=UPI001A8E51BF|nr:response regulator transcription factor [Novosphingobium sp. KA1]QSR19074.1 DNA-binding response regulator [Novosphingobium sp. KA1]